MSEKEASPHIWLKFDDCVFRLLHDCTPGHYTLATRNNHLVLCETKEVRNIAELVSPPAGLTWNTYALGGER